MEMQSSESTDSELLADWSSRQREPAFRQLVVRYGGLVHMAAKRTCGDDSMAAEASQLTFILLAQKGKSLTSRKSIAGWLHLTAVMQAKNLLRKSRSEIRKREKLHATMDARSHHFADDTWNEMQPVLDDALAALSEKDREALLLHFYRSLSAREIAETLGIATAAARKRIDRATEKLRGKLVVRGCKASASLGAALLAGFAADAKACSLPISAISANATSAVAGSGLSFSIPTLTAMKASTLIPPALALMIASLWIFPQRDAIAKIEKRNGRSASIGDVAANRSTVSSQGSTDRTGTLTKSIRSKKGIDWESIGLQVEDDQLNSRIKNLSGFQEMILEERLQAMSSEELLAQLDTILTLDISSAAKKSLESRLGHILARKDPAFALEHLERGLEDNSGVRFALAEALKGFAKDHPEQAAAWLDLQIASGKLEIKRLDGRNWARDQFQSILISNLLVSDPAAADRRLSTMTTTEKIAVLGRMSRITNGDEQIAYAKLVRENLPEKASLNAISLMAWGLNMNLSNVNAYMDRIEATPEERQKTAEQAAIGKIYNTSINRKLTVAELIPTLKWLEEHNPESANSILGDALGRSAERAAFSNAKEIAEIVLKIHDTGQNDDLIESFVNSPAMKKQADLAKLVAARTIDEKRRNEMLDSLK